MNPMLRKLRRHSVQSKKWHLTWRQTAWILNMPVIFKSGVASRLISNATRCHNIIFPFNHTAGLFRPSRSHILPWGMRALHRDSEAQKPRYKYNISQKRNVSLVPHHLFFPLGLFSGFWFTEIHTGSTTGMSIFRRSRGISCSNNGQQSWDFDTHLQFQGLVYFQFTHISM